MDDVTKTLQLLQLELPDFEQELSSQNLNPETFTCFDKLPLDIRRMIWKMGLPRRRFINLDSFMFAGTNSGFLRTVLQKHDPKLPTALRVTQESRKVALEHYTIMSNPWECGK
jgi:2EXR family